MVFSVYANMNKASHVKLGGYDELGALGNVTGNENFTFIKTDSNKSWKMNLVQVWTFGIEKGVELMTTKYAIPEVAYPYIYMPMSDFNQIADYLNDHYHGKLASDEVLCVKDLGKC